MKRIIKRVIFSLSAAVLAGASLSALVAPSAAAAAGATLSLSPATSSVQNGNQLSLNIYEDSGSDQINAVQANLSFPNNLLNYVTTNYDLQTFEFGPSPTVGSGSVQIARATSTPKTGKQLVATVVFKAVAGSGSAAVTFDSSSAVVMADGNGTPEPLTRDNGTYTLTSPPPPPSGGGSGGSSGGGSSTPPSSGGTTTKSGGSSSTTPPSSGSSSGSSSSSKPSSSGSTSTTKATKLTTSDIKVTNVSASTATVNWQTSVPASSEVDFGLDTNYGLTVVDSSLTTNHHLVINSSYLKPGETYHYAIKSIDANGNVVTSSDQVFKTTAAETAAPKKNNFWLALAIVVAIGVIVIAAAETIRRLRHHHQGPSDLTHGPGSGGYPPANNTFANPSAPPTQSPTDTVIRPTPAGPAMPTGQPAGQPTANINITNEGELRQSPKP